jgi:hypothetical protein
MSEQLTFSDRIKRALEETEARYGLSIEQALVNLFFSEISKEKPSAALINNLIKVLVEAGAIEIERREDEAAPIVSFSYKEH